MNDLVTTDGFAQAAERFASLPNMDAAKLRELLEIQLLARAEQAKIDFNIDMAKLRAELPAVLKNKRNSQTDSMYADLNQIKKVVDPLLNKYGFYDRYEDDYPEAGLVGTTCEIVHKNGHSQKSRVQFALDDKGIKGTVNKTIPHATASSMTYGQRLSLCRALGIRVSEDDDGNGMEGQVTADQAMEIDALLKKTGSDRVKFFNGFLKLETTDSREIPAKQYAKALNALKEKEARSASA